MVKCKTRKRANALQEYCLAKEAAEEARRQAKRQKAAEKRQRELSAAAGANGEVAALDGVRFSGTFGVTFAPEKAMTKQGLRQARKDGTLMETEDDDERPSGPLMAQSARKKAGFEVARRNYLIKKSKKMAKQREKREVKNGKKQVLKLSKSLKA